MYNKFTSSTEIASENIRLDEVFRRFQVLCLEAGADWVPYLAGGADTEGYDDVISPAIYTILFLIIVSQATLLFGSSAK